MKAPDQSSLAAALLLALAPLIGLIVNIATQIVISRLPLPFGQVRRQFLSFGCGLAATAWWLIGFLSVANLNWLDATGCIALHVLSYLMIGFIFFNIINLNISSLRIRMLKEYLRAHPSPLADQVLRQKYHTRGMLDARLERLAHGGQLSVRAGRYYSRRSFVVLIGHFFAFLRNFLLRR